MNDLLFIHIENPWHDILHALFHALKDTLIAIPFLFIAYLLMEFIEHKASSKMESSLKKYSRLGPFIGAPLGCIPQCGFSATASNLYTAGMITEGTLLAVFLATSDEAIPILLSSPDMHSSIWKFILCKLIIAIFAGVAIDFSYKLIKIKKTPIEMCEDCGCEEESGIFKPAIKHTAKIALFILIVNLILEAVLIFVPSETLNNILLSGSYSQPFITALLGLIPNCAISVAITELYVAGSLSFGSAIAGLCSGAGVGLAVLFKTNKCLKENIRITVILYLISALFGFFLMLAGI
ncbi:MAG: arsenic efflux protein [Clostridia bacterium]|nr:arsenic efflux protein [Clostridia bacterium]